MSISRSLVTAVCAAVIATAAIQTASAAPKDSVCGKPGTWIDADDGAAITQPDLFSDLTANTFVLLGETHDNAEHHRWQLHTLAALHGRFDDLMIGFEMFPRRAQPALDQWVRGELSRKAFLDAVNWRTTWGFDPDLYMPLFNFARMHRIPMIALNVDRQLVSRVGSEGWDAVPVSEREGIGKPAAASAAYQRTLAEIYLAKQAFLARDATHGDASETKQSETIEDVVSKPEFKRFVEAQQTWDRAMAEGLAEAKQAHPEALVVGVMGSGHLSYFHGVPHQLDDLGFASSAVLLPVDVDFACDHVGTDYADALFTVVSPAETDATPKRMRLGVVLRDASQAALIDQVVPGSVAQATDLREGDRIVRAAGVDIDDAAALVEVIGRQAPGTWLPITVERDGSTLDLVAKFPAVSDQDS